MAVAEEPAGSITGIVAPTWLAKAFSGPRMAHFGIVPGAVACPGTVGSVLIDRTNTLATVGTGPPVRTAAFPIRRITRCPVLAAARLGAVDAVLAVRAGIKTLGPHKPGRTDTLARHAVTVGPVEAFTAFRAP